MTSPLLARAAIEALGFKKSTAEHDRVAKTGQPTRRGRDSASRLLVTFPVSS
jgi:hypothetical protein